MVHLWKDRAPATAPRFAADQKRARTRLVLEDLLGRHAGDAQGLGHGRVHEAPSCTLRPARKCRSSIRARGKPLSASASTNGTVILVSAKVEVRETAPGM